MIPAPSFETAPSEPPQDEARRGDVKSGPPDVMYALSVAHQDVVEREGGLKYFIAK